MPPFPSPLLWPIFNLLSISAPPRLLSPVSCPGHLLEPPASVPPPLVHPHSVARGSLSGWPRPVPAQNPTPTCPRALVTQAPRFCGQQGPFLLPASPASCSALHISLPSPFSHSSTDQARPCSFRHQTRWDEFRVVWP